MSSCVNTSLMCLQLCLRILHQTSTSPPAARSQMERLCASFGQCTQQTGDMVRDKYNKI